MSEVSTRPPSGATKHRRTAKPPHPKAPPARVIAPAANFAAMALTLASEAEAVLRTVAEDGSDDSRNDAVWGVMTIVGILLNDLERIHSEQSQEDCRPVICHLEQAIKAPAKATKMGHISAPDPIKVAFCIVQTLLDEASATAERHAWSGDSDRLLRIAHNIADDASIRTPNASDAESVAFNIAALIRAAKLVPGDSESEERRNLLDQAAVQLNWLTGCDTTGSNCIDPGAQRPMAPATASSEAPSPSERAVAATGASLLGQAVEAIQSGDGAAYAADLLKFGRKALQLASEGVVIEECIRDVFFLAAGVCTGALAIEQRDSPEASHLPSPSTPLGEPPRWPCPIA